MTTENLGEVLTDDFASHQRRVVIENLSKRTHLTLGQVAELVGHEKHGQIVKDVTLQDLLDEAGRHQQKSGSNGATTAKTPRAAKPKTSAKKTKTSAKKTTSSKKKTSAKKKTAKKTSSKKKAPKSSKGPKADKGKPKPRLDYDKGMREVLAAVKAAEGPLARSDLEKATGFTGVQVRTFAKRLAADGKIKITGKGGRSTRYDKA